MRKVQFLIILCVFVLFLSGCGGRENDNMLCSDRCNDCCMNCYDNWEEMGYATEEACNNVCYDGFNNCLREKTAQCFIRNLSIAQKLR